MGLCFFWRALRRIHFLVFCSLWKWKLLSRVWLFATPRTTQSMEFSRPEYWSGYPSPSPGDLPYAGIEPRSSTLQVDSLPSEPLGTPKNTEVGSLSLFQWILPTQESNWGLLHCRWILYQLSYQGSPIFKNLSESATLSVILRILVIGQTS